MARGELPSSDFQICGLVEGYKLGFCVWSQHFVLSLETNRLCTHQDPSSIHPSFALPAELL